MPRSLIIFILVLVAIFSFVGYHDYRVAKNKDKKCPEGSEETGKDFWGKPKCKSK